MTSESLPTIDAYCTLGWDRDEALTPANLLAQMDRNGMGMALIAPDSGELAVRNREGNQRIAEIARTAPDRFLPAFTVNPWIGAGALDVLDDAKADGGRVLVLAPHRQGFHLGDSLVDTIVEWAVLCDVPVYAHGAPTASGTPSQMYLLAQRFPEGRFLLGGSGTSDYAYDMLPLLRLRLPNLWCDTGFVRPSALQTYAAEAPDRVCFASRSPQNDLYLERELLTESVANELLPGILGTNFLNFLQRS